MKEKKMNDLICSFLYWALWKKKPEDRETIITNYIQPKKVKVKDLINN